MLSDKDILDAIKKGEIKIEPFHKGCLTAVGYDLRLGVSGVSLTKQQDIDIIKNNGIRIAPHEMVIVLSLEEIYLSKKISGTIHAQVKRLNQGLQAISATADPDWNGHALLHLTNNLDKEVFIPNEETIATICFYRLDTPTELDCPEPRLKTIDWNVLRALSKEKEEKTKKSLKYRLLSTRLRYLLALVLTVIVSAIAYFAFKPGTESFAGIIALISVLSLYLIEFLK